MSRGNENFITQFIEFQFSHQMRELDAQTYREVVQAGDRVPFEPLLDPLLITRVPGTQNHVKVREVTTWVLSRSVYERHLLLCSNINIFACNFTVYQITHEGVGLDSGVRCLSRYHTSWC